MQTKTYKDLLGREIGYAEFEPNELLNYRTFYGDLIPVIYVGRDDDNMTVGWYNVSVDGTHGNVDDGANMVVHYSDLSERKNG